MCVCVCVCVYVCACVRVAVGAKGGGGRNRAAQRASCLQTHASSWLRDMPPSRHAPDDIGFRANPGAYSIPYDQGRKDCYVLSCLTWLSPLLEHVMVCAVEVLLPSSEDLSVDFAHGGRPGRRLHP